MEAFQAEGGNTGMLAFEDHLHAQKPIEHTAGKGKLEKSESGSFQTEPTFLHN